MPTVSPSAESSQWATRPAPPSLSEALAHCRLLARSHYENFTVASWLLPRRLRPHFWSLYAYCRTADDLADETGDPAASLALLDDWQRQLDDCYRGAASHPVFVALAETIRRFEIPRRWLADLLVAFRQDQRVRQYDTLEQLLDYCRHSANPVGRLVLCLDGARDEERGLLADQVCTGLQLVNFWQDVAGDFDRGRVYLPRAVRQAAGYDDEMLARRQFNPAFRRALAGEVERAESYLHAGRPLVGMVSPDLRLDVALFIEAGLAVARRIRSVDYNVWARRPVVTRAARLGVFARAWRAARRSGKVRR